MSLVDARMIAQHRMVPVDQPSSVGCHLFSISCNHMTMVRVFVLVKDQEWLRQQDGRDVLLNKLSNRHQISSCLIGIVCVYESL